MNIEDREFKQYLTIKKKLAPKSIETYIIRLRVIKRWLIEKSIDLTKEAVEKFLYEQKEKGKSNAAVNTYIQTLNHLEGFYKDRGIQDGFMEGIASLPKEQPEIVLLSIEEMERLLNTHLEYKNRNGVHCGDLDLKYLALTRFLAITGSRFEEAASLKVKRLDISNGKATLVKTKNKQNRYIYFEGPIKRDLEYLVKDKMPDDLVFTNSKGQHVKAGDYNVDLRTRAKAAGITKYVHAHLLRHCYGTRLVESGVDISKVASLMGHRDVQTTYETYVHLADDTLQKASLRNPVVSKFVKPEEILKMLKENISKFHIEEDARFKTTLYEQNGKLRFEVEIV